MFTDVFDIFDDILNGLQTTDTTKEDPVDETVTLNGIDLSKVSKEELDETMEYLAKLKDNSIATYLLGDEYIDKVMGELQAKWDIAHEAPESEPDPVESPKTVDDQINQLVNEYIDSLGIDKELQSNALVKAARDGYINFAKFIYNHK